LSATPARYVTLAYGRSDSVYRQASMLLLSLLAYAPTPRELLVVTDHPERFGWFEGVVRTHAVTPEQVTAWQGVDPFSMRIKLEVPRVASPSEGVLVLLDADTIATADLTPMVAALAGGAVFMHTREFELGGSRRRGNRALWRELQGRRFGRWQFRPHDAMWNSGVIAVRVADVALFDEALELYDTLGGSGVRHFATEQLVVGLVLGRTGRLREASPWFIHYWGNKPQFEREINRRLDVLRRQALSPLAAAETLRAAPVDLPAELRLGRVQKLLRWMAKRP
jgi:hypothetical protein